MSVMYQSEFDVCKMVLQRALCDSGIPEILWCNYARLMAEEIACELADSISAELHQTAEAEKQKGD